MPTVTMAMGLGLTGSPASATNPGWVDLAYGVDGVASLPAANVFGATTVDSMGRAVVLGTSAGGNGDRVSRLTLAGAVDSTFGTAGTFVLPSATFYTQVTTVNGAVYVLGGDAAPNGASSQVFVTKLTSSGTADSTFGMGGTAAHNVSALSAPTFAFNDFTVRSDGDVIISLVTTDTTHTGYLLALTPTGAIDTTFGTMSTPGWVAFPAGQFPYAPKAALTGASVGVLVGHAQPSPFGFQTYSSTGTVGQATTLGTSLTPVALAPIADGTFWVTGSSGTTVFLGQILANGAINVMNGPGLGCSPAGGQIEVSGSSQYVIAFNSDQSTNCQPGPATVLRFTGGQLDASFGASGQVTVDFVGPESVVGPNGAGLQPDGHLLVGVDGTNDPAFMAFNPAVVRLNTAPAPAAVEAFVQGGNDMFFSAEHVADNPARFSGLPSPVVDASNITDVFLKGTDGHLYIAQRLASGWTAPVDITAAVTGGPTLGSPPYAVRSGSTLHVLALATGTKDLVDYHNDGPSGAWVATDVSLSDPGSPAINPTLSAVQLGGILHVYGTTASGDLVEIDNDNMAGHQWNFYDESAYAGGGVPVTGAPGPLLIGGIPHVYSRASGSGDLVEFVADHIGGKIWNAYDQTRGTAGSPALSGNPIPTLIGSIPHVYVDDAATGDLVEFVADHLAGHIWNSYDQTILSGAPQLMGNPTAVLVDGALYGQAGTEVPEVFENGNGTLYVVAADHQGGSIWNVYDVTDVSGGSQIAGDPAAVVNGPFVEVLGFTGPAVIGAASTTTGARKATSTAGSGSIRVRPAGAPNRPRVGRLALPLAPHP